MIDFMTGLPIAPPISEVDELRRQLGAITNVAICLVRWRGGQCRITRAEIDAITECSLSIKGDGHGVNLSVSRGKAT